jgi:hypothetical protein
MRPSLCAFAIVVMFLAVTTSVAQEQPISQPQPTAANRSQPQPPHLTLVVIDRIDFRDLLAADTPTLKRLMNEGAVGLISPRVVGALTSESACVTIGAGTPAAADEQRPPTISLLSRWDGKNIFYGNMAAVRETNRREATLAQPGLLGSLLRQHHLKTAVWKVEDTDGEFRHVVAIAADEHGRVDKGYLSGDFVTAKNNGFLSTYRSVEPRAEKELGKTNLRVIHVMQGDGRDPRGWLHIADTFLDAWLKLIDLRHHRVMIVTPCPLTNKKYFPRLAPVIMVGKGIQRGVLTSPSTRQRGLVTLADIAPTALEYFNIPKDKRMVGQAMTVLPSENPVAELRRLDEWIAGRNQAVAPVAVLITVWQVVATALALVLMRQRMGKAEKDFSPYGRFALLGAVAIPLAALLVSPLAAWGTVAVIALALALTCALAGVMMQVARATASLRYLAMIAFLALIVDALMNGRLSAASILGNSFATGSRFYGVGNEYAGYLMATALITAGLSGLLEEKKWRAWLWMFLLVFALGCAKWGANFGGASTAAVACSVAIIKTRNKQFGWQQLSLVMIMVTVAVAAVVGWELLNAPASQSHIGRTFSHADGGSLLQIAKRKLQMGWHVIRYTPFNYPLLLAIPVVASVLHWRRGRLKAALAQHRAFDACMVAGVVGSIVALVINDSGIVIVGIMLGTLVPALMFILQNVQCPMSKRKSRRKLVEVG